MPVVVGPGAPGSTVDLVEIFLNDADDPTDFRSFKHAGDTLSANTTTRAEARQLMNRRRMVINGAGAPTESQSFTLQHCNRDDVAWLLAHAGKLICFRDHVGTKFFGFYKDLPRDVATQFRDWIDVKISIESIDHSEAV